MATSGCLRKNKIRVSIYSPLPFALHVRRAKPKFSSHWHRTKVLILTDDSQLEIQHFSCKATSRKFYLASYCSVTLSHSTSPLAQGQSVHLSPRTFNGFVMNNHQISIHPLSHIVSQYAAQHSSQSRHLQSSPADCEGTSATISSDSSDHHVPNL